MVHRYLFLFAALLFLASCEKAEEAIVLPQPGGASHASIDLGANNDYVNEVFFDFESGKSVAIANRKSWDLAFEAGADGKYVFLNGGSGVLVYNTHQQEMAAVNSLPQSITAGSAVGWSFDEPSGLEDATGVGAWWKAKRPEVYILETVDAALVKLRLLSVDDKAYNFEWAPLASSAAPTAVRLLKDSAFNFTHYSFTTGPVQPEPPKAVWDVVFTRYRYVYHDYPSVGQNFPYEVEGVLLNPCNTRAAADSVGSSFAQINLQLAMSLPTVTERDVIGFDWKSYSISGGQYQVNRAKCYVVHTRKNQLYKLHFLDYYNSAGVKGNPSFEFERLR